MIHVLAEVVKNINNAMEEGLRKIVDSLVDN